MTIESFVLIGRPAQPVFEFVTNASLWHYWHPATASVTATPPRPLVDDKQPQPVRDPGPQDDKTPGRDDASPADPSPQRAARPAR